MVGDLVNIYCFLWDDAIYVIGHFLYVPRVCCLCSSSYVGFMTAAMYLHNNIVRPKK